MKALLRKFIPPVVFDLIKKNSPTLIQKYSSYEDALQYCTTSAYENQELVEVIYKKTKKYVNDVTVMHIETMSIVCSMLSLVNPIIESKEKVVNILDFGGACGLDYFQIRHLYDESLRLNWAIVETPAMVKVAKDLETNELSFSDNLEDAAAKLGSVDLLHTSGTLQCVDSPERYLDKILGCNARWILFSRLGLSKGKDVVTIHSTMISWHGIGEMPEGHVDRLIKFPFTFMSESKFLHKLKERYSIVAKLNDPSGMYHVENEQIVGYGLLCRRKD